MSDQTNPTSALGNSIIALIDFQIAHTGPNRSADTPAYTIVGTHSALVNNVTTSLTNLIQARIEQHINLVPAPESQVGRGDHESHLASLPPHLRVHSYLPSDPGYGAHPLNGFVPAPDLIAQSSQTQQLAPSQHQPNFDVTSVTPQQDQQHSHTHQPQPAHPPAPLLDPSPMSLNPSHTRHESEGTDDSSGGSGGSQGDVNMPDMSPDDIPSPNPMFDMPNSSDEDSPEDPTISDPNHPNYRPLYTWEALDRSLGQGFTVIPPRPAGRFPSEGLPNTPE